ncbi:EF-hand calcium-binding domain-containing protein 10 [Kappamyces sp. JEL0680]|nr:EF-hand calcium-binding domain-containing protein 10 [Kappamyces sp. JEL0680]
MQNPATLALPSDEKYYKGEKLDEAQSYLATHRIAEIIQSLTQALLVERPDNPREFMERHLQMLRSVKARNQNHVQFTRENLMALFRFYDQVGRGYISMQQYHEAMATIGATKYSLKPNGYGKPRASLTLQVWIGLPSRHLQKNH